MKRNHIYRNPFKAICLCLAALALVACTKEDNEGCPTWLPVTLKVVVTPTSGEDALVEPDAIRDVRLYVFNETECFVDQLSARVNETVTLDYPEAGPLHLVVVANADQANETVTAFNTGDPISNGSICIRQTDIYQDSPIYCSPSDLFHGEIRVLNNGTQSENLTLPISRIVAGVNVTLKGIRDYAGAVNENFAVILHSKYHTVDFGGNPRGDNIAHRPPIAFFDANRVPSKTCMADLFNIFSTRQGEEVTLKVYYEDTLIDTITADSDGQPLKAVNGKYLHIVADYSRSDGMITVIAETTPWGQENIGKDF